jgi:hypothetical protein
MPHLDNSWTGSLDQISHLDNSPFAAIYGIESIMPWNGHKMINTAVGHHGNGPKI